MMVYIGNPRKYRQSTIELTREFSNVAGYKIHVFVSSCANYSNYLSLWEFPKELN